MSFFDSFAVSSSGMGIQQKRMDITAENLANTNSTQTPEGGPYQRKSLVVGSVPVGFQKSLGHFINANAVSIPTVMDIEKDPNSTQSIYDPNHPDANEKGFVEMPNINMTMEMVDMLTASKAYEANVTVFNAAKSMVLRTLEIGGA